MPTYSENPTERALEERCVADVAKHGLHVLLVHGDDRWPPFAYTVGLFHNYQHPELIVFGLPTDNSHPILNHVAAEIKAGKRFVAGQEAPSILVDSSCTFREIPPAHVRVHFGWAAWFYGGWTFPTLQLIWPDRTGLWPWDPAVSTYVREQQPLLQTSPLPGWAKD